jgi:hypothetical protein
MLIDDPDMYVSAAKPPPTAAVAAPDQPPPSLVTFPFSSMNAGLAGESVLE